MKSAPAAASWLLVFARSTSVGVIDTLECPGALAASSMLAHRAPPAEDCLTAAVEFHAARLGYGATTILEGVNFEACAGEVWAVVGPSGSGKSTLLLAALGLLPPLGGSVRVSARARGWVPQHDRLDTLHPVSVAEVLAAGMPRTGRGRLALPPDAPQRTEAALAELDLSGFGPRAFETLSGGQRQRVLVARALLTGADVLAFDEPTSALDEPSAARVVEAVQRAASGGATVLYATHHIEALEGVADGELAIQGGHVLARRLTWT